MTENKKTEPMNFFNMTSFLQGQSSKIITSLSEKDEVGYILKNGKPLAVLMSNDRYERLLKAGININEY